VTKFGSYFSSYIRLWSEYLKANLVNLFISHITRCAEYRFFLLDPVLSDFMSADRIKNEVTSRSIQEGGRQAPEWVSPETAASLMEPNVVEVEVETDPMEGTTEDVDLLQHESETLQSSIIISHMEPYATHLSESADLQLLSDDSEISADVTLPSIMPNVFTPEWMSRHASFLISFSSLEYNGKLLFENHLVEDRLGSSLWLKTVAMSIILQSYENQKYYTQFVDYALSVPHDTVIGPSFHKNIQGFRRGSDLEDLMRYRLSKAYTSLPNNSPRTIAHDSGWYIVNLIECSANQLPKDERPYQAVRHFKQSIPTIDHFQLRNLLVSPSQYDAFYANKWKVCRIDPSDPPGTSKPPKTVLDLENEQLTDKHGTRITTLDLGCENILMAGCFNGTYAYLDLLGNTGPTIGRFPSNEIVNHISISPIFTHPTATIACNDPSSTLLTLDLATNQLINSTALPLDAVDQSTHSPIVNCTAISPCGRLRLLVGDFPNTLVTDARCPSATLLNSLPTPALSFAAAWAPDAWHVATASDVGDYQLWDARMWRVVQSWHTDMAPVRTLRFGPLGGGAPLRLFAAESYDRVHVVDVRTALEVQTMCFLGEVGGLSVSRDGSEVMIANGDCTFGGITVYEQSMGMGNWKSAGVVKEWDGSDYRRRNTEATWSGFDGLMSLDVV
jgi:hypothetical protein